MALATLADFLAGTGAMDKAKMPTREFVKDKLLQQGLHDWRKILLTNFDKTAWRTAFKQMFGKLMDSESDQLDSVSWLAR